MTIFAHHLFFPRRRTTKRSEEKKCTKPEKPITSEQRQKENDIGEL
jgi:hypothetical protein